MASKKDKYLESAQRYMLKGQLDKAIKDYQQVVALEPKEIRYRQKLAELLVKDSRKDEAIAQYADIGKHYADNSYFLKAIAVYKQIQRLAPGNTEIALMVASLNHKQGLIGNALAEYGQILARLEKEGAFKEALQVAEQMLSVDTEHVPTRLKHAELLFASGAEDASYQAFAALVASLKGRGDQRGVEQVSEHMKKLFPKPLQRNLDGVAEMLSSGDVDGAIAALQDRLKRDERDLQAWQLLCDAQRRKGNRDGLRGALARMMELFPEDLAVVKGAIRCEIDAAEYGRGLALLERHLPLFVERGESQSAEELLRAFPPEVAHQLKATEWLKRFCEASGAGDGAAENPADAVPAELPDAFAPAAPAEAQSPFEMSAFEPPMQAPDAAATASADGGGELSLPWEEEIQLDLDDDLDSHLPKPEDVNVHLDFSLSLDLAEEETTPAPSPFAEPAAVVVAGGGQASPRDAADEAVPLDLEDSSLELTLPDDPEAFPDWSDSNADTATGEAELPTAAFGGFEAFEAEPKTFEAPAVFEEAEEIHDAIEEPEAIEDPETIEEPEAFEEPEAIEDLDLIHEEAVPVAAGPLRGWEEIYPVSAASEAADLVELESHYDLGIGYKEMGMYDGAIRELDIAARNPQRRLACLTLQAMCLRDKGETEKARDLLQRGLDLEVLSGEERNMLSYELAFLLETTGAVGEAIELYRQVHRSNPSFHDVGNKLFQLTGEEPLDVIDLETVDADL